ncbi:hypothetical protein F894_00156 [Acinetobacter sp. CIP 51.11]|uniref:polysaccharide pyruvyl transferase family protein n=1 Tax=Acinetobacter sp. CIP 51.11 TaxID=1144670 RepID=UPI0002D0F0BC|nr:polysaccharide pyruvyl transferase family protein [Acinetobacter sp. CIP 51.11]ENX17024.1 hypothetical protein F894_00156 [Acinetobacter sp. CIP 51.11]
MKIRFFNSDILFTGYYGQLNAGDDAFIEVTSWGAKKYWNKNENIFLAKESNLPITTNKIRGYPLTIPKTYRFQNRFLLASTNYLISSGGSTLHHELLKNDIKRIAVESKIKGSNKIKIGGIGVSIGPFRSIKDEKAIIEYLKNIDFLAVRDQASFDYVQNLDLPYNVVNAFDLAALLPEIYDFSEKRNKINGKKVIGVSVCPVESITNLNNLNQENKRNSNINELLKTIDKNENVHFKFFIINGHSVFGDLELTKKTIESVNPLSYEIVYYTRDTRRIWNEISDCDFIISTRLHAAIFACFSETPFMLNEYHRKCKDFLDNVDYDKKFRMFDDEYDYKEKANLIISVLNNDNKYIKPKKNDEMKIRASLNFTGVKI